MNNFKVLENLNQNTSLIIIDESTIALDDRFFAYYRGKYEIEKILQIIKNCILRKILEKELFYKNEEYLENSNEKLLMIFDNLQFFSSNDIFTEEEKILITETIKDLIIFNKEMDKKINNLQNNLHLLKNDALQDVPNTNNENTESNERFCYYQSLNRILVDLKNYLIIAKNKTLQGIRYVKIKFMQYAVNIRLHFN